MFYNLTEEGEVERDRKRRERERLSQINIGILWWVENNVADPLYMKIYTSEGIFIVKSLKGLFILSQTDLTGILWCFKRGQCLSPIHPIHK